MAPHFRISAARPQRASLLIDVMLSILIGGVVAAFVSYLTLFAAKTSVVLYPQMSGQMAAARALQQIADHLCNAKASTISLPSSSEARFESIGLPEGQTARIVFSDGQVVYYPDASSTAGRRTLGKGLESVTFSLSDQMVEVAVVFKYRKARGYGSTERQKMNGTFVTRVFPRNA